ncbi:MAG: NUDIX hydrolase [Candidatus Omnitrophica bacterium]|nr:NUDIX hydrolase [Candidatus Omnitrophota bacterium]
MKSASYQVKKRKVVYSKGPIHLVDCEVKLSSGRVLSRQIIEHPGSVVIIPKFGAEQFGLIRQFRFAARTDLWEFPAGGIEPSENLRQAAARELSEEIGYHPRKLTRLMSFYPSPGISSEVMHLFLGENLTPRKGEPDDDEEIELQVFSAPEIFKMIQRKKIVDAKTLLGMHFLKSTGKI